MAPTAIFFQEGDQLDFTPASAVNAGDVIVQGDAALVAVADIPPNRQGALVAEGVFKFPKATTTGSGMPMGKRVFWDATNEVATLSTGSGANKPLGLTAAATADSDTVVPVKLLASGDQIPLRYAAVAASSAVTNTTTETAFSNTHTIPANTLQVGDVLKIRAQTIAPATNSTDTLTLKLKIGSTVIAVTAATDVANNDIGYFDAMVVVRANGSGGTIVAAGAQGLGTPGTVTSKPFNLAATAIDTTVDQLISVSATWSVANAGDSCRLDLFTVERLSA
ncbi:MAG TPA: capsid cement protein [Pirellulales bacterium]|jgi:predicted RecA/RadA family phage recombinase|nr:capsid cement protein [Pirellulales bacterium]